MSASFLAFKNASNPSNCICCTLKQKFLNLHKNLKLVEKRGGGKKECHHPLAQPIHGYNDHRRSMWRRNAAVWSWLCVLPVVPVVVATEYLAD